MPSIRPISDLRNNANEISDFCRQTREPVFITRNGTGDMVVMNLEEYERQMATIDLYGKLAIAEQQIADGDIVDYLNTLSQEAALKYYDLLTEEILSLREMPERCPRPRDLALAAKGYRYLIVGKYLVFYVVSGDTVQIRRILYGRRDYKLLL